jgi:cell wall-associated NlpC family hydrolase
MIARADVVAAARTWIGATWHHQGRSEHGVDCVGLVVMVCRSVGLAGYTDAADVASYPREPKAADFVGYFLKGGGTRVPILDALPGDLLLFREQRYPCHVAILASDPRGATIIHAHATRRAVLEEAMIAEWLGKRVAAIRLPGVG